MFEAEYIQIGCRVAYYRKMKRFTQKELALRANISVSYLSRIERGAYKKGVPISTFCQIARALNVHISDFFKDL